MIISKLYILLKVILMVNQIKEYCGISNNNEINTMNSYLIQVELVNNNNNIKNWKSLTIEIEDNNNNFGWAKVFNKIIS